MKIQWVNNARHLYLLLASNQLMLLAALLSGIEAGVQLYLDQRPWAALAACVVSIGATIARMVSQPKAVEKAEEKAIEAVIKKIDQGGAP